MDQRATTILVVEDEEKITEGIKAYLESRSYQVICALDGEAAISLFEKELPDLVILDLMLPKKSGEEVCRYIRQRSRTPIIMLTAKVREEEKLQGFSMGADDYVTKPFSPRELLARVDSILRRCKEETTPLYQNMSWGNHDLELNMSENTVRKKGKPISLTANEFKLLKTLAAYPNKVFTREELIVLCFGYDYEGLERTIDAHIKNLRSKIEEDSQNPVYILTVRGLGYRFGGGR